MKLTALARRDMEAQTRIRAAMAALAEENGLTLPDLPRTRDRQVEAMLQREAVAGFLEELATLTPAEEAPEPEDAEAPAEEAAKPRRPRKGTN